MVDIGGSLVLASRGLYSTGVSTDLNVTYLSSGGKVGDLIRAEARCDRCTSSVERGNSCVLIVDSWENACFYHSEVHQPEE